MTKRLMIFVLWALPLWAGAQTAEDLIDNCGCPSDQECRETSAGDLYCAPGAHATEAPPRLPAARPPTDAEAEQCLRDVQQIVASCQSKLEEAKNTCDTTRKTGADSLKNKSDAFAEKASKEGASNQMACSNNAEYKAIQDETDSYIRRVSQTCDQNYGACINTCQQNRDELVRQLEATNCLSDAEVAAAVKAMDDTIGQCENNKKTAAQNARKQIESEKLNNLSAQTNCDATKAANNDEATSDENTSATADADPTKPASKSNMMAGLMGAASGMMGAFMQGQQAMQAAQMTPGTVQPVLLSSEDCRQPGMASDCRCGDNWRTSACQAQIQSSSQQFGSIGNAGGAKMNKNAESSSALNLGGMGDGPMEMGPPGPTDATPPGMMASGSFNGANPTPQKPEAPRGGGRSALSADILGGVRGGSAVGLPGGRAIGGRAVGAETGALPQPGARTANPDLRQFMPAMQAPASAVDRNVAGHGNMTPWDGHPPSADFFNKVKLRYNLFYPTLLD